MKVLFAGAECYPLVKVGGLGDVMGALPGTLHALGTEVRIMLPGYPAVLQGLQDLRPLRYWPDIMGGGEATLLLGEMGDGLPVLVLDQPGFFQRPGGPYDEHGGSHRRFAAFSWAIARVGLEGDGEGWQPQVVHCNDWQTGLAPAYLALDGRPRPGSVLTIHNLAYQGNYPPSILPEVWLPPACFHMEGVEFNGSLSFLKAGLYYADLLSTVSPTYAREIQEPGGGYGLEGLLAHRSADLRGILNGVDPDIWNPLCDPHLASNFDARRLQRRAANKAALQREAGLAERPEAPLCGIVSRIADIKGLDLVLENIGHLVDLDAQLLVLGQGDPALQEAFRLAAERHPGQVALSTAFDEALAHRIFGGSDLVLVPSRSEPCGLTQLYALRYGALPLVRETGGLADTVVDASPGNLESGRATGFSFREPSAWVLGETLGRACALYREQPAVWAALQRRGMKKRFGWVEAARDYRKMYQDLLRRSRHA